MHHFCNYTHGWFLLALLNSFPMTFMSPNWAKCGKKFPAVLIVLGSDVRRTQSYVWIEVIVIHLRSRFLSLVSLLHLTLAFSCFSGTRLHTSSTPFLLACGKLSEVERQQKGILSRRGSIARLMSSAFLSLPSCSPACVSAQMLPLSPSPARTIACNEWVLPHHSVN